MLISRCEVCNGIIDADHEDFHEDHDDPGLCEICQEVLAPWNR